MPNIEISEKLIFLLSFIPIFLISITIHEFAHAFIANLLGDDTAKKMGRVTLNPVKHMELFGSVLMPLISFASGFVMIGWAKPVPVNRNNFKDILKDDAVVSFAGPFSNLMSAILFSVILFSIKSFSPAFFESGNLFIELIVMGIYLNILLFVFNLLPIPPLDGSHILFDLFPNKFTAAIINAGMYGFIFLMLFIYSPLWGYFIDVVQKIFTALTFYI